MEHAQLIDTISSIIEKEPPINFGGFFCIIEIYIERKVMSFIEVPYLEKVPYPIRFGPTSDKPLPPKYKLVSDRRQIIDLDKVVCADTFHGVLIGDDKVEEMSNLDTEFIEFVYGENIRVAALNPEKYLGLLLNDGTVERNNKGN